MHACGIAQRSHMSDNKATKALHVAVYIFRSASFHRAEELAKCICTRCTACLQPSLHASHPLPIGSKFCSSSDTQDTAFASNISIL